MSRVAPSFLEGVLCSEQSLFQAEDPERHGALGDQCWDLLSKWKIFRGKLLELPSNVPGREEACLDPDAEWPAFPSPPTPDSKFTELMMPRGRWHRKC